MSANSAPVLPFDDDRLGIGGNNPPDVFRLKREDVDTRVVLFLKGLDVWSTRGDLDADTAPRALDFQKGLKLLKKEADESRTIEKKPHDDAAKAVQSYWKGIEARLDKALDVITPKLAAWQTALAERKRQDEIAARNARLAAEREADAQRAAAVHAQSESARIEAEAAAEAAAEVAKASAKTEKLAAAPARIESATGLANRAGTRTEYDVIVTDPTRLAIHFRNHPDVHALLVQLVKRMIREAPTVGGEKQLPAIPGANITSREVFK